MPYFSLKQEFLRAVSDKLSSGSAEEEDYIFRYLFGNLKLLADQMPASLESILRTKLKQGNGRFHDAMLFHCPWDSKTFTPELAKAIEEFKEAEKSFNDFEDDIPF